MGGVMLSSLQHRDTSEGGHEASMQFTTQTQQLTTCPQCDNVVHIDAEFCNICGKRLRPAVGTGGTRLPGTSTATQTLRPISSQVDEEEYEDDDEEDDDDSEEVTQD